MVRNYTVQCSGDTMSNLRNHTQTSQGASKNSIDRGFSHRTNGTGSIAVSDRKDKFSGKKHEPERTDIDKEDEEQPTLKEYGIGLIRDIIIAVIVMIIIIGSLYGYTRNWPPMVVVESNSMMHDTDSSIDVIDTGDLVLVKKIEDKDEITTYVEGRLSNYKTYGTYGDVIIFRKNNLDDTPVIHRAVVWIEYNESGQNNFNDLRDMGSFDVPSMRLYDVTEIPLGTYVPHNINMTFNLRPILENFKNTNKKPHGGFLTKGDNNDRIDQTSLTDNQGLLVEPILVNWIVGKAEGELPWFGLIKLYISGDTNNDASKPPETSQRMLIISIFLIIFIPILLDLIFSYINKRSKKKQEDRERAETQRDGRFPPNRRIPMSDFGQSGGPGRGGAPGAGPGKSSGQGGSRLPPGKSGSTPTTLQKYENNSGSSSGRTKEDLIRKIK